MSQYSRHPQSQDMGSLRPMPPPKTSLQQRDHFNPQQVSGSSESSALFSELALFQPASQYAPDENTQNAMVLQCASDPRYTSGQATQQQFLPSRPHTMTPSNVHLVSNQQYSEWGNPTFARGERHSAPGAYLPAQNGGGCAWGSMDGPSGPNAQGYATGPYYEGYDYGQAQQRGNERNIHPPGALPVHNQYSGPLGQYGNDPTCEIFALDGKRASL